MSPEDFRRFGHEVIDWIADYRARIADLPVQPSTAPGDVRRVLPGQAPRRPEPFEALLADLDTVVLPNLTHWQHPRFFGYFPANSELSGVLADLVSTGLGVLGLSWQSSPALTEVEEVVVDWLRQLLGLSDAWVGVIQDTASTANLVAVVCARERTTAYGSTAHGLQGRPSRLILYASGGSHTSVAKAARIAGFGDADIRTVPLDARQAMKADVLDEMIEADLVAGLTPCAVVACVGGTATTSIDPIADVAAVARKRGLWLHVDAAMAGTAMILPECRHLWEGVEDADSLVVNGHKWLGTPFDCSLYYVRDEPHLLRVMSTNPSFLQSAVDGEVRNLRDTGIPLGRRFRALKLWFLLREQGVDAIQRRLRRDIANARLLADWVAVADGWSVVAPVTLQTVCVRYQPADVATADLDDFTRAWAADVNASGDGYLTPAIAEDRWMVRVSVGALATEVADVEAIWASMRRHAEARRPTTIDGS